MPGRGWGWGRKGTQYLRRRSQDPGSGEEGTSPPHHWGYSCRGQAPPLWPARAVALPSGAAGIFTACPAKPAPDRRPPTPSSSWAGSWPCPHFSPLHPGLCSCFRNNGTWVPRPLGTHPSGIIGELAPMLSAGTAQDPALPGAVSPWAAGTRPRLAGEALLHGCWPPPGLPPLWFPGTSLGQSLRNTEQGRQGPREGDRPRPTEKTRGEGAEWEKEKQTRSRERERLRGGTEEPEQQQKGKARNELNCKPRKEENKRKKETPERQKTENTQTHTHVCTHTQRHVHTRTQAASGHCPGPWPPLPLGLWAPDLPGPLTGRHPQAAPPR